MLKYHGIAVPFGKGLDTKSDEKSVSNDMLLKLENAEFTKMGKIRMRSGYEEYPLEAEDHDGTVTSYQISAAKGLASRETEMVLMDGRSIYSWSDASSKWVHRGGLVSAICEVETVAQAQSAQTGADYAESGSLAVYAWEDSRGGVYYSLLDSSTGTVHIPSTEASADGKNPHCIAVGEKVLVLYYDVNLGSIMCIAIHPDSIAETQTPREIASGVHADGMYDACSYTSELGAIVWKAAGSTGTAIAATFNSSGIRQTTVSLGALAPTLLYLSMAYDGIDTSQDRFFIGYNSSATAQAVKIYSDVFVVESTKTFNDGIACCACTMVPVRETATSSDNDYHVYFEHSDHLSVQFGSSYQAGTSLTLFANLCGLGSKGWRDASDNTVSYVTLTYDSTLQSSYFVLRDDGRIVARFLPGTGVGEIGTGHLPAAHNVSGSKFAFCAVFKTRLDAIDVDNETAESSVYSEEGLKRISLDFDHAQGYHAVQMGKSLYINGGILHEFDGSEAHEAGFLLYPEPPDAWVANTSTPATGIGSGDFYYHMYWEHKNIHGERLQSSFAGAKNVTPAATKLVEWTEVDSTEIESLPFTHRDSVALAVYRTQDTGTVYTRVSPLDPTGVLDKTAETNGWVENDKTADYVEFTDILVDADMESNEADYQNTLELDNLAPPSCTIIGASKDRLFLAGGEIEQSVVRYSKLYEVGKPLSFNDALVINVDRTGGDITALAPLNDSMAVFKNDRIYVVDGDGPTNLGFGGNLFSEPQLVTTDCGCKTQKSIVQTPDGIMFQSHKGIYLLSRDWRTHYIGAPVEAYNDETITAATVVPDSSQVVFLTASGSSLMYDYVHKQWAVWTMHDGVGATVHNNKYSYVNSLGQVYRQDSSFTHGTTPIRMRAETSWLKFGEGLQGYQAVRDIVLLGTFYGHHNLNVRVAYDYRDNWVDTKLWSTSGVVAPSTLGDQATLGGDTYLGGSGDEVYQVRIFPSRVKCQSIKFEFSNDPLLSSGRAFELSELGLQVALTGRNFPVASGRNV